MKNISQEIIIPAKPIEVYNALMDEKKHANFTSANAKISQEVGGEFEVWDGYASGTNIELIKGKKIIQSWHASDWPEETVSEITIELLPKNNQTKLKFDQKNVPDEFFLDVKQGWQDYYWQPLIKYFSK